MRDVSHDGDDVAILLAGVPEMTENPLEPLARYFTENGFDGDYRVVIERRRHNPVSERLAIRRQRRLAERAGGQRTESSMDDSQTSRTTRDHSSEVALEDSVKELERRASRQALKCWVYVSGTAASADEARSIGEGAASVLHGTMSSHRKGSALKTRRVRAREGKVAGRPTVLLPVEAVPYFWIPQVSMGTEIAPAPRFELVPALAGEIELGRIVRESGVTDDPAKILLEVLVKHVLITGITGYGKTTTCLNLLLQLYRLGVPFLVIEPVKTEYRGLIASVPSLQVFTIGDEETAPFRLNIFEPPPGVKVLTHLEHLEAVWNASFVMYSPMQYLVKEILLGAYESCGWDIEKDTRGRPISLEDLEVQVEKVVKHYRYDDRVTMDIEAAFKTRISNLTVGGKGPLFDTMSSFSIEGMLRRPTVIELKSISSDEEKAFIAALILTEMLEYLEAKGMSRHLRHLTLVEEAHRLLPNISTEKGDPETADPRRKMAEQFSNMLAEVRAYGEGLAIVEQSPTKIIRDAIANTTTKIAHRVANAEDARVLAGSMNLQKEQAEVLEFLRPGEALLYTEQTPLPIRILGSNAVEKNGMPVSDTSDEDVRRHMAEYYLANPLPKETPRHARKVVLKMVEAEWFRKRFREGYEECRKNRNSKPLEELILQTAAAVSPREEDLMENASKVLALAVGFYLPYDEEDRSRFHSLFMQTMRRSARDARRR